MRVVDGQHRAEACRKLGKPIFYVCVDLDGKIEDAIDYLNQTQSVWDLMDYIVRYRKAGIKSYQEILDCQDEYKCTTSTAVSFVGNTISSGSSQIRKGAFKKGKIHYSVFGDIYLDFKNIFKDYSHVFFVRAMVAMIVSGRYDHKLDFKRFEKHRYSLKGCANYDQYIAMLEDILNRNRRGGKIKIFDNN